MTHPNTTLIPFSDEWEQYMLTRPIEEVVAIAKQLGNENLRLMGNRTAGFDEEVEKVANNYVRQNIDKDRPTYNAFIAGIQYSYSHPDPAQLVAFGEIIINVMEPGYIRPLGEIKSRLQQMAEEFKGGKES